MQIIWKAAACGVILKLPSRVIQWMKNGLGMIGSRSISD